MWNFFGWQFDPAMLRIPIEVAIAVILIIIVFAVSSKLLKFFLIILAIAALGFVGWEALVKFGLVPAPMGPGPI